MAYILAPEAWVETDVKYFFTFEKFLDVFSAPHLASYGLETEGVAGCFCLDVGFPS